MDKDIVIDLPGGGARWYGDIRELRLTRPDVAFIIEKEQDNAIYVSTTSREWSPRHLARLNRLMPDGRPRYVRVYDNGGQTIDRYTVVFSGRYKKDGVGFLYVSMDDKPFDPQGFCQHGESAHLPIDYKRYGHLGKKMKFEDLPADCRIVVLRDYQEIWQIVPVKKRMVK